MRKLLLLVVLAVLAWTWSAKDRQKSEATNPPSIAVSETHVQAVESFVAEAHARETTTFVCDGRTYCSQMTSCEEATYFLQHCPNVKMDGDNDGVPCEKQWCS